MTQVLYIDDEPDILELAEIFFTEKGLSITTAGDAHEALRLFNRHPFQVVISDARMPGLTGIDLFHQLQSQHGFDGHFILVSGRYGSHDTPLIPEGINLVLTKPIDFDDLIETVSRLLSK